MPVLLVDEAVLVLKDDLQMVKSEEPQIVLLDRDELDSDGTHDISPRVLQLNPRKRLPVYKDFPATEELRLQSVDETALTMVAMQL